MCGPETSDRPRGGALVALVPPSGSAGLRGDLVFDTPGRPDSVAATHARLTPHEACEPRHLHLVIHASGDLTRAAADCGLFRRFALPCAAAASHRGFELELPEPLSLDVGPAGIIGRRVSLCARRPCGRELVVAQGIVGFNFVGQSPSSL